MSESQYTSSGGGALKIKGAGVDKKKKKKKPKAASDVDGSKEVEDVPKATDDRSSHDTPAIDDDAALADPTLNEELKDDSSQHPAKTEAERRHEERRRKRLHERLKREGVKTHKERVEELNRYLSAQSDHHDMPKIGPG